MADVITLKCAVCGAPNVEPHEAGVRGYCPRCGVVQALTSDRAAAWRPQDRWPTSKLPDQAGKFYGYMMYREWCFGPFDSEEALRDFVRLEDARERAEGKTPPPGGYWRYDGLSLLEGHPNAAHEPWPWPSCRRCEHEPIRG